MILLNWFLQKKLKWQKMKALFEIQKDIIFIERHRAEYIDRANVDAWRTEMAALRKQENPNMEKLGRLMDRIAEAEATIGELHKLRRMAEELPEFIAML